MTYTNDLIYCNNYVCITKIQACNGIKFDTGIPCSGLNFFFTLALLLLTSGASAQLNNDTVNSLQNWNLHFQNTVITQYHPSFHASYSGENSLHAGEETQTSITSTIYFGVKLWRGAECYFNPELSGGSGFSYTRGIAGFTNGEVYRVDDPKPKVYLARLFFKQVIPLTGAYENAPEQYEFRVDDINQLAAMQPKSYIAVYAGRFSITDFFDGNRYSHDPRTQFFNWALMDNGAWDYPANTRGYTNGVVIELVKPLWTMRIGAVMVPTLANGPVMDPKISKSRSEALEFEHSYNIGKQKGRIRIVGYLSEAQMGNYKLALALGAANDTIPNVDAFHAYGRTKYGAGLNIEHAFSDKIGMFFRSSWNDGHNETWEFTEIDRHASTGLTLNGALWNRKEDNFGIAQLVNGISKDHRDYLAAGGYGFIIGDGRLNYGPEYIGELYYCFRVPRHNIWLTPDYQFIMNPAYNKDRGPVNVFSIRFHAEI